MGSRVLPIRSIPASRNLILLAACLLTLAFFGPVLKTIVLLGIHDDRYLQIVVAPLACGVLLFVERTDIFSCAGGSRKAAIPLLAAAVLLALPAALPLAVLSMILLWMAAFVGCWGAQSFRLGLYPLSCLLLMIPLPSAWMDRVTVFLQHGSAATAYRILRLVGMPVFRHDMVFSLPGLDFEVGAECSGIHSSLALLMIALVAGYLCLRSGWSRAALLILTVPIALLKNAIRIVTITVLAARVDRAFIDGPFHHRYGGVVFSTVAVALFVLVLAGLQRAEFHIVRRRT